ncbi:MAG: DNA primase [Chlorobiaceae bacterium]|nr:DNA primase [Chlorobiaceae bacterium]
MIPHSIIDDVRQAADIVDIISDYLTLQPAGRNYKALSPFTKEKTPSFVVSPDKQIYKCFSTGKGGNVFSFVMEMEKVSFPEAIELVAKRTGIDISRFTEKKERDPALEDSRTETLRWAAKFFQRTLESEAGKPGKIYLATKRALSEQTIKTFGLGYALDSWDSLFNEAKRAGIPLEHLTDLGLVTQNKQRNSWYDTFRSRVIFPVFSVGGQVVGFGGRTLLDDPQTPKYLNSPESKLFEKSKLLYGLHAAKNEIRRMETAILVEGYMDVLALHQAGLANAVASCGTSLTRSQAKILQRYTNRILFMYDADSAGKKSMMSGLDTLLAEGITPFIVMLPEGDDPDTFVRREGREKFLQFAEEHMLPFQDFQIRFFTESENFAQPDKKSRAIRGMAHTISLIPDRIRQELYLQELSTKLAISQQALHELLGKEQAVQEKKAVSSESRPSLEPPRKPTAGISVLEKTFLKALLESAAYGTVVLEFATSHEAMLELPHKEAQEIFTHMVQRYHDIANNREDHIDMTTEISRFSNPESRDLASGLLLDPPVSNKWLEQADVHSENAKRCLTMFLDAFKNLILEPLIRQKIVLTEHIRIENDTEKEIELFKEKIVLDKKIQKTSNDLKKMIATILENS